MYERGKWFVVGVLLLASASAFAQITGSIRVRSPIRRAWRCRE